MKLGAALAVTFVAIALAASATGAPAAFSPQAIAGTWTGTWTNTVDGSKGPARIVATPLAGNTRLAFTVDLGDALGCTDAPADRARVLTKGSGPGHWNTGGFQVEGASKALGNLTLSYRSATGSLTASGANPPCAMDLQWSLKGKFAGRTFAGTVTTGSARGTHTVVSALKLKRAS